MRGLVRGWPLLAQRARPRRRDDRARHGELDCAGIAAEYHGIDERGVDRAAQAGLEVAAWTVTRRPTYARMVELGVVAVCVEGAALDG